LGVLEKLQTSLKVDQWLIQKFQMLREAYTPTPMLYLGVLAYRLRAAEVRALAKRLKLGRGETEILVQVVTLNLVERQLTAANLAPSRVAELLDRFDDAALAVFAIAAESAQAANYIDRYRGEWRAIQSELSGRDLKALGLPPGPSYKEILRALRARRLDGTITSRAQEEEFARAKL
jgi:tRNA nucleotidyltransferase (CCA-adding enzyme)